MLIQSVRTEIQPRTPSTNPIRDAIQTLPGAPGLKVIVETDSGVEGTSHTYFGRVAGGARSLQVLIDTVLSPVAEGQSAFEVRAVRDRLRREVDYIGCAGLALWGISAIDVALWDALGKAMGRPCHQLWGACRDRIPAYAMVGWLNYPPAELAAICRKAVDQGFRAVKMKVGAPTLEEDVARIRAVRAAIGADAGLMVDANQSLALSEAVRRGRAYQELGCLWFEEPLAAGDHAGLAELARTLDIPIASGENDGGTEAFQDLLSRGSVDIVQADLRRAGGATEILEIGALAAAFRKPYAAHGGGPADLHLLACIPTAEYAELGLLAPGSPVRLEDGQVLVPQGPGFSWNE